MLPLLQPPVRLLPQPMADPPNRLAHRTPPPSLSSPAGVVLTGLTFIAASLIPLLSSTERKAVGPFTPAAEMLNGRAAMIGLASLIAIEAVRGSALF